MQRNPTFIFSAALISLALLLGPASLFAAEPAIKTCEDRPECWPEGSAMNTGLMLQQRLKAEDKALRRSHDELNKLLSSLNSPDGTYRANDGLLQALKAQQRAWVTYRPTECELVGWLTGAGGSWPSVHATKCEIEVTTQRILMVRVVKQCIEDGSDDPNSCLERLTELR